MSASKRQNVGSDSMFLSPCSLSYELSGFEPEKYHSVMDVCKLHKLEMHSHVLEEEGSSGPSRHHVNQMIIKAVLSGEIHPSVPQAGKFREAVDEYMAFAKLEPCTDLVGVPLTTINPPDLRGTLDLVMKHTSGAHVVVIFKVTSGCNSIAAQMSSEPLSIQGRATLLEAAGSVKLVSDKVEMTSSTVLLISLNFNRCKATLEIVPMELGRTWCIMAGLKFFPMNLVARLRAKWRDRSVPLEAQHVVCDRVVTWIEERFAMEPHLDDALPHVLGVLDGFGSMGRSVKGVRCVNAAAWQEAIMPRVSSAQRALVSSWVEGFMALFKKN
jgi:hypothetical protein